MSWHGKYFKGASRERKLQKRAEAEARQEEFAARKDDKITHQPADTPRSS